MPAGSSGCCVVGVAPQWSARFVMCVPSGVVNQAIVSVEHEVRILQWSERFMITNTFENPGKGRTITTKS